MGEKIMENKKITAYSLYNIQQKERTKINPLEDIYPQLPDKKYQVIYADCFYCRR